MELLQEPLFIILFLFTLISLGLNIYNIILSKKNEASISAIHLATTDITIKEFISDYINKVDRLFSKVDDLSQTDVLLSEALSRKLGKVGFLRFNPYKDTGGDQSFCIALLDNSNSGVLITSLYHRGSTQVYAKLIDKGESKHTLNEEETKTLNMAKSK